MSSKKSYSGDEDSYSYIETESETVTELGSRDVSEYNYKDAFLDIIYSKGIIYYAFFAIPVVTSFLCWNINVSIIYTNKYHSSISLGVLLFFTGSIGIIGLILGYIIERICLIFLKSSKLLGSFWYYSSELSYYISSSFVLILLHFYIFIYHSNFYFKNPYNLKLTVFDSLRILLLTNLLLGLQKALVKNISMGFNYNNYINRIRKCIFLDFFTSLITHINEFNDDVIVSAETSSQNVILLTPKSGIISNFSFLFQDNFRSANAESLCFQAKRVLIKEFMAHSHKGSGYSDNLPAVMWKMKTKALRRANKLARKLVNSDRIEKIGDMQRMFDDKVLFEYFIDQLDLSPSDKIERDLIASILERAYKDKFVINKNIKQINSAINKVALFVRLITYFMAMMACYISATGTINVAVGVLSAIFGTQFISNILSESILQSIIFLFVIHPFDIGDRVFIRLDAELQNLEVAELNVFSTIFFKWDGTSVFVPNRILARSTVVNIRRSGAIMESHSIQVNTKTDPSKIEKLREMLVAFSKKNPEDYTDYILVNYEKIEDSNKLYLKVLMQYQQNWQKYDAYLKKRSKFVCEMNRCVKFLKIKYKLPLQKIKVKNAGTEISSPRLLK